MIRQVMGNRVVLLRTMNAQPRRICTGTDSPHAYTRSANAVCLKAIKDITSLSPRTLLQAVDDND